MGPNEERVQIAAYVARLVATGLIAAFSLVGNAVSGVMASMLISPIGGPITTIPVAVVSGKYGAALKGIAMVAMSAVVLVGSGIIVRMWDTWRVTKAATPEMEKRTQRFNTKNTFAYAILIGALMAINGASIQSSAKATTRTLEGVGLALAISVSPPLVNAGIVYIDHLNAQGRDRGSGPADPDRRILRGANRSAGVAACNIAGMIVSGIVVTAIVLHSGKRMR